MLPSRPTMADDVSNAPIFAGSKTGEAAPEYEFGDAENHVFDALARAMSFVGTAQGVMGASLFAIAIAHVWMGGPPALISSLPMALTGAMFTVTGVWLRRASLPIARIVTTKGSDIRNLMEAMAGLAGMFALQRSYFIAAGVVAAVSIVGAIIALALFADVLHRML